MHQLRRADDGTLWIASSLGLFRLPAQSETIERVGADVLDDVAALLVDHAHRLYAGSYDGLYRIDERGTPRRVWPTQGTHAVTALAEDAGGRLWLAVPHEGLVGFDPEHGDEVWIKPERNLPGTLPAALITNLLVDRSGLLWIATGERGLARMDPAGSIFQSVVDQDPAHDAIAANNVHAIFEDASRRPLDRHRRERTQALRSGDERIRPLRRCDRARVRHGAFEASGFARRRPRASRRRANGAGGRSCRISA